MGLLWAVLLPLGFDQWTKTLALAHLQGPVERILLEGLVGLRVVTNGGAAFGFGFGVPAQWLRVGLLTGSALLCVSLFWMRAKAMQERAVRRGYGLSLLLGGMLGNSVDRLRNGFVVDFVHLHLGSLLDLGTINLADLSLLTGIGLLLPDLFRRDSAPHIAEPSGLPSTGSSRPSAVEKTP